MSMTGDEDGGYIRSPISPIDQMTGVHASAAFWRCCMRGKKPGRAARSRFHCSKRAGLLGYNLQTFWERGVQPPKLRFEP